MAHSAAATSTVAPDWFDAGGVGWDEPLPGLPDFVTLAWIERWHSLTPGPLRRLDNSVRKAPASSPLAAWWPRTMPFPSNVPHLLAQSMVPPAAFAELARHHALAPGARAGKSKPTLFQRLRDAFDDADDAERDALFESHTFVSFLEDPADATRKFAEIPMGEEGEGFALSLTTEPSLASLTAWLRAHFPDVGVEIDRRLPGAAQASPEAVPPAPAEVLPPSGPAAAAAEPAPAEAAPAAPSVEAPAPEAVPAPADAPAAPPVPVALDLGPEALAPVRIALSAARDGAAAALAVQSPSRSDVRPVVVAALAAAREARRLERSLLQPVSGDELLAMLADAAARVAVALREEPAPLPAPPLLLQRPAVPGLRALADALTASAADVEVLFERARERSRAMVETNDFSLAAEVVALQTQMSEQARSFGTSLTEALDAVEAGRYRAPAPAPQSVPRVPEPAAAQPVQATAPVPAPAPAATPALPVEVLAAVVLDLGAPTGETFRSALDLCLSYLAGTSGDALPAGGLAGETFALDTDGGSSVRAYAYDTPEGRTWAGRRDEPCGEDPSRRMTLELTLAPVEGSLRLGIRVCTASASGHYAGHRMLPALAAEAVGLVGATDNGITLPFEPRHVPAEQAREVFETLVLAPRRRLPVVAVSLDGRGQTPLVSVSDLAQALSGAAHVVVFPDASGKVISTAHGREWSVYNGAVRVYLPGVNTTKDDPARHRKHNPDQIARLNAGRAKDDAPFERMLVDQVLREGVGAFAETATPTFGTVEADSAHRRSEAAARDGSPAAAESYAQEAEAANRRAAEASALADLAMEDTRRYQEERDELWSRNTALAARIESLQAALAQRASGGAAPEPAKVPETVEEVCRFAETELGTRVFVMPKAIKETGKTRNLNVARLHDGLVFLRDVYVPYRRGELSNEEFKQAQTQSRFKESACFADRNVDRFDGYTAEWRGRTVKLDRHLKWSFGSTDTMIRIYFHYDEDEQCVVVGHMPSHLPF